MKLLGASAAAVLVFCLTSAAQYPAAPPHGRVIDGSKEPDSIPDNVAWLMLFKVLADGPDALPLDTRASFLKDTGLTGGQITRVIFAANRVAHRVKDMEGRIMNSGLDMEAKTQALRQEREAIIDDAVNELLIRELAYDDGEALLRHVREKVKRGVRIVR